MPYTLSTRIKEGKRKFCMTSKDSGKTYCYDSEPEREKGMALHEYYSKKKKGMK